VRGKRHEIHGSAVSVHPWYNFSPSHVAYQTLMQWRMGSRIGYSEMADISGWNTWPHEIRFTHSAEPATQSSR
jgi:hypothetical protein